MNEAINEILTTVVMGVLSVAGAYATMLIHKALNKIKAETEKIKSDEERQMMKDALNELEEIAGTTVCSIEETIAKEIRKKIAAGTANRSELCGVSELAVSRVLANMSVKYREYLQRNMTRLEGYVRDVVEKKVNELKQ